MTCSAGTCVPTVLPDAGDLNGSCLDAGTPCDSFDAGTLECVSGSCQIAGCPSGDYGCPCAAYGACKPVEGKQVACVNDRCVAQGCAAGTAGCGCKTDGTCDTGGTCSYGVCRFDSPTVTVGGPGIRACDVVLTLAPYVAAQSVTWDPAIKGAYLQRGARLALSFIQRSDVDMANVTATVDYGAINGPAPAKPTIASAVCWDRLGWAVPSAVVKVE